MKAPRTLLAYALLNRIEKARKPPATLELVGSVNHYNRSPVTEATVYNCLQGLLRSRLIAKVGEALRGRGSKPVHLYALTPKGKQTTKAAARLVGA